MPKIEIIDLAELIAAADAAMREETEQPETLPPGSLFDLEHALAWVTDPKATRPRELRVTAAIARDIAKLINRTRFEIKPAPGAEAPDQNLEFTETPFMGWARRKADAATGNTNLPPLLRAYVGRHDAAERAAEAAAHAPPEPLSLQAALGAGPAGIQVLAADHVVAWTGDIKDAATPPFWGHKRVEIYQCYGATAFEEATAWLARYVRAAQ